MNNEQQAFLRFANILNERLQNGIYTTEESVRYIFFESYLGEMCDGVNIFIAELPFNSPILNVDNNF